MTSTRAYNILAAAIITTTTSTSLLAAWAWTSAMGLNSIFSHPASQGSTTQRTTVLVLDQNFHSCGWNSAGQVSSSIVGDDQFKMIAATALTALSGNKTISLLTDGCDGDRAKVYGIQIVK